MCKSKKIKMKLPEYEIKMVRQKCPRCGEQLKLEIIGFASENPVGFMPVCPSCGFRDWGNVL